MRKDFGFKKSYGIDIGTSMIQYQTHQKEYIKEHCFNNAFICLSNNFKNYHQNKAVIGYVLSTNGIRKVAVRHCWNIINGIAVDVTMIANQENPIAMLSYTYLPTQEYVTDKFVDAIEKNNGYPALPKTKKEYYYRSLLKKRGFEILE